MSNDIDDTQIINEWFANDYLLVAENDYDTYTNLLELKDKLGVVELSDKLRYEWDLMIDEVLNLTKDKLSEGKYLLLSQLLMGWGCSPFDRIAKEIKSWEN